MSYFAILCYSQENVRGSSNLAQLDPISPPLGPEILEFPRIQDPRGNLTFIEAPQHLPFPIRRVYYLYDVPGGANRGGHAHRRLEQCLIAVSGSFDVTVDTGRARQVITLNRSFCGLYLPNMVWRELSNFATGSVCLVLASEVYSESDYIRRYDDFVRMAVRL